jgi:hypothetical protein
MGLAALGFDEGVQRPAAALSTLLYGRLFCAKFSPPTKKIDSFTGTIEFDTMPL